jgi:hypothetical protein
MGSFFLDVDDWLRYKLPREVFADVLDREPKVGQPLIPSGANVAVVATEAGTDSTQPPAEGQGEGDDKSAKGGKRPKRSTERGEGQLKLIGFLTRHHQYAEGGCLNQEPIGSNKLARQAQVSKSTASVFFRDNFQGHAKYRALCRNAGMLAAALKLLNNEYAPHDLYGRRPPGEDDRDAE